MKETELAEKVVIWLQDYQWEVYQEVQIFSASEVADIVAVQNKIVWVIECKTSFSLAVIAQANKWKDYSHYSSIAVPQVRASTGSQFGNTVLRRFGVGKLELGLYERGIREITKPQLNRKAMADRFLCVLSEKHKTFAKAGNNEGLRFTPFQDTCSQIAREVAQNPGLTIKELLTRIRHHYASPESARSSLLHWANAGKIRGIEVRQEGKYIKFYPKEEEKR